MNSIVTKIGVFEVKECAYNKAYTEVYSNGKQVAFVKCAWWDGDNLSLAIEAEANNIAAKRIETLIAAKRIENLENEQNKVNVNATNVLEVLQLANSVLKESIVDAKDRGFVCSRLSQIINKLQVA